jgi:plastocyanin
MRLARRRLLLVAAAAAFGVMAPGRGRAAGAAVMMNGTADGSQVWFDPIGLWVAPGTAVTWANRDQANTHTVTAYHPANGSHSLRIPETAEPWDSGYLLPGKSFTRVLTVEGVYDYFCRPHELVGMVGRIVVGQPAGPGTRPFDWFKASHPDWQEVPAEAQQAFPPIETIMSQRVVHR